MSRAELIRLTAREAVRLLRRGEVSPLELIEAAEARIHEVDGVLNALPTVCVERARQRAGKIASMKSREGHEEPWLAGLPIAIKDLTDVAGVRTTYGSPIFADHVPGRSDLLVETLEQRGAIVLAKSNTPEFGAGGNTFNEVFGITRNPWNTAKTCGGSSGGSAVALASGQVWLATGSDLGGSLRTPASFCSVVGLRPSPGRVAHAPDVLPFNTLLMEGPMARDVRDVALMLDAMSGEHPRDPLSLPAPAVPFSTAVETWPRPGRVAFTPDLGGATPVHREVAEICRAAAQKFSAMGIAVEEASPDFSGAREIFLVLRAVIFVARNAPLLERHRDKLKPDVVWNIEEGLKLSADTIARAERARGELFYRVAEFFETYDLLLCPAAIVPPFDATTRYVSEVEGHSFDNYIDWLLIASAVTLSSCPALSLPCGFTRDSLPVGLQMVGRPRGEAGLLRAAALLEDTLGLAGKVPIDPRML